MAAAITIGEKGALPALFCAFDGLTVLPSRTSPRDYRGRSKHRFRRPAQAATPFGRHNDRPVDQDRVRKHESRSIRPSLPFGIAKPQLRVRRGLFPGAAARTENSHGLNELDQAAHGSGGGLQILMISGSSPLCRIIASVLREGAAGRVVIDGHAHKNRLGIEGRRIFLGSQHPCHDQHANDRARRVRPR